MHDAERQLRFMFQDGDTFEICLFGTKTKKHALWNNEYAGGKKPIIGGWYQDIDKAVKDIKAAEKINPTAIIIKIAGIQGISITRTFKSLRSQKTA